MILKHLSFLKDLKNFILIYQMYKIFYNEERQKARIKLLLFNVSRFYRYNYSK